MTNIIFPNSQKGKILDAMKTFIDVEVKPEFFMQGKRFVGYEASARLSELRKLWLVEIAEVIRTQKNHGRYTYKITQKGLEYKFGTPIDPTIKKKKCWPKFKNIETMTKTDHLEIHQELVKGMIINTTWQTKENKFIKWIKIALKR